MAEGERSSHRAVPCTPRGYLPTTEAFFTFQLSLKIIVFCNCRHKMKYDSNYFTDRIVNLQKSDFAFFGIRYILLLRLCRFNRNKIHNILTTRKDSKIMVIHKENYDLINLPGSFRQKKQKL